MSECIRLAQIYKCEECPHFYKRVGSDYGSDKVECFLIGEKILFVNTEKPEYVKKVLAHWHDDLCILDKAK